MTLIAWAKVRHGDVRLQGFESLPRPDTKVLAFWANAGAMPSINPAAAMATDAIFKFMYSPLGLRTNARSTITGMLFPGGRAFKLTLPETSI